MQVIRVQKRLGIKGYHNPQIKTRSYYGLYTVSEKFLFFDRLNEIALLIRGAGLYDIWWRRYDATAESTMVKISLKRLKDHKEADIDRFPIPMFIFYLWLASVVEFIIELDIL